MDSITIVEYVIDGRIAYELFWYVDVEEARTLFQRQHPTLKIRKVWAETLDF